MGKFTKVLLWIAILAVIGIAIYPRLFKAKGDGNAASAPPPKRSALPVEVTRVMPSVIQDKILVNGNVLADEQAELRAEFAGRVTEIHFEEGSPVKAGDVLVKINDTELQADKRRLKHELELARETEQRQRNLLAKGTTSQENFDRARNRLQTLKAELEVVEARLEKTIIRAPFDGVMGFRYISLGSYLTTNTRIAGIQKIDSVKIGFAIPGKYAGKVSVGKNIRFTLPGRERVYQGKVYAVEPRIDAATRTLPIRARTGNPDGSILPGTFASVELIFEEFDNALLVPSEALIPALGGQKVFVAVDGKASERKVKTGIRTPSTVQVIEGLQPGDLVIRTGILQLREGAAVQVAEPSAEVVE
ncbi:MAG: efflux RND transporter periplasmic adaptor subunit [Acidobacteriota bacterium]|nr:efflux RND transporter periplasmic adaptor subunit [Acidobacteriota bacterium]